ncbi:MarC family protein [Novipirellula sp. SH528]|uniref:MarC family protein n=1 Tax=Novipirellula sp. SH528 TaxID=3454466 RepID=UPI003F9FACEE
MIDFFSSTALLLTLLNPFLVIIYLVDLVQKLKQEQFVPVLVRAGFIAGAVFCSFAILGETIFSGLMQVEFASFQIFGGIVFLLIGIQFVFRGPNAIEMLRGESKHIAGSIAMPVLIGPGTISASVIIGKRHDPLVACTVVVTAIAICLVAIILLKSIHDFVHPNREGLVDRYIEIAGRITALYVGTVAIDMVMQGIGTWVTKF